MSEEQIMRLMQEKHRLLRSQVEIKESLPHLYGFPWYEWAWKYFNSTNKICLITAANQVSKSSSAIRKKIDRATNVDKWKILWPHRRPSIFWYFYPSMKVATVEFEKKWVTEFLPRGAMRAHPQYGWQAEYDKKFISHINFNSGITMYFNSYEKRAVNLQTATVDDVTCDEECPMDLYDEIMARLIASNGYFDSVFTATLGQDFWWRAMEAKGELEELPSAFKQQISLYDCLKYMDGTPSPWTVDRIKEIEARCKSKAEILRRVHGRFVRDEGRKYYTFDPTKHYTKRKNLPLSWHYYGGVDIGSGGKTGHPSAITMVAVRPDYKLGYVYKHWRGDGIETTSADVLDKYRQMKANKHFVQQKYDGAAKDFGTIATRQGEPFEKANKKHEEGEDIVNTLFKNGMLILFDDDPQIQKLGVELIQLNNSTPQNKAKNDSADSLRYCVVDIPWDFSAINGGVVVEEQPIVFPTRPTTSEELAAERLRMRRGEARAAKGECDDWLEDYENEVDLWNEAYGN